MEFIFAFIIFVIIVNIIGLLFSVLWPLIVILVIAAAIVNLLAYYRRKKSGYYHSETTYYGRNHCEQNSDIIDVEYTESEIDEDR